MLPPKGLPKGTVYMIRESHIPNVQAKIEAGFQKYVLLKRETTTK